MFKFQRNQTKPKLIRIFLVTSIHRFKQQRKRRSPLAAEKHEHNGRVPFDQHFRKFRFKIEWNRNFPEIRFENFGSPFEVVLFSVNLEIPEIFCSIWHFYPVWIGPSFFSHEKLQDGGSLSSQHYTGCKMICHSSSLFLIAFFHENVRFWFPGKLWTGRSEFPVGQFAFVHSPARKVRKFLS